MGNILVWAEIQHGNIAVTTLEALGKAGELASTINGKVEAVLIGDDTVKSLATELISYGVAKVHLITDARLGFYQSDIYPQIFASAIAESAPQMVLIGGTSLGMDIAPRVAAKLNTGLTAHCIDLFIETINGKTLLFQAVSGWGGNMAIKIICPKARPQMVTLCAGMFTAATRDTSQRGEILEIAAQFLEQDLRAKTIAIRGGDADNVLQSAAMIVSGGFGMLSAGGFDLLKQLAQALNAKVAGTRAAYDQGWIGVEQMIGQSGISVSPQLFISIAASGAMHYTAGFSGAGTTVAIDKNPAAPIFAVADFGIVGDAAQIIPAIIEEVKRQ